MPLLAFLPLLLLFTTAAPALAQGEDDGEPILEFTHDPGLDFSFVPAPEITHAYVVRYATSAAVLLRANAPDVGIRYRRADQPGTLVNATVGAGGLVLDNLPLDKDYEVFALDAQNVERNIGGFSTRPLTLDVIALPGELYYPAAAWMQNPGGQNFYELVRDLPGVHYLAKSYLIQQFFYGGGALSDGAKGQVPDAPPTRPEGDCLCRPFQLYVEESPLPIAYEDAATQTYLPVYKTGDQTVQYYANDKGKRWYAYSYEGPAMYQQVWNQTTRCINDFSEMPLTNQTDTAGGGNIAQLRYSFNCVGLDDFMPEDCPCIRPRAVKVAWRYAAEAEIFTELRGGWCPLPIYNGKAARAVVDNLVTVMYAYSGDDLEDWPMPLDGGRLLRSAGCATSFDPLKLYVNYLKAVFYAYKAIKSPASTVAEQIFNTLYGIQASNALEDLVSDDYVVREDTCGTAVLAGSPLLDGSRTLPLRPGEELTVVLYSASYLNAEGKGRFAASARLLSAFGLVGVVEPSDADQTGPNCCSNGHGVYSLSSFTPLMSMSTLYDWVEGQFDAAGFSHTSHNIIPVDYTPIGEYGYVGGGERPGCQLVIVDGRSTIPRRARRQHVRVTPNPGCYPVAAQWQRFRSLGVAPARRCRPRGASYARRARAGLPARPWHCHLCARRVYRSPAHGHPF